MPSVKGASASRIGTGSIRLDQSIKRQSASSLMSFRAAGALRLNIMAVILISEIINGH